MWSFGDECQNATWLATNYHMQEGRKLSDLSDFIKDKDTPLWPSKKEAEIRKLLPLQLLF